MILPAVILLAQLAVVNGALPHKIDAPVHVRVATVGPGSGPSVSRGGDSYQYGAPDQNPFDDPFGDGPISLATFYPSAATYDPKKAVATAPAAPAATLAPVTAAPVVATVLPPAPTIAPLASGVATQNIAPKDSPSAAVATVTLYKNVTMAAVTQTVYMNKTLPAVTSILISSFTTTVTTTSYSTISSYITLTSTSTTTVYPFPTDGAGFPGFGGGPSRGGDSGSSISFGNLGQAFGSIAGSLNGVGRGPVNGGRNSDRGPVGRGGDRTGTGTRTDNGFITRRGNTVRRSFKA